jgi:hypothetical protein
LKRDSHQRSEDAAAGLAATNFDEEEEEEQEGSSNSSSVGKTTAADRDRDINNNNNNNPSAAQSWALAVREEDEEDAAAAATQGMNVQSLQQHNPAHAGPSDPDNHLHLHGIYSSIYALPASRED